MNSKIFLIIFLILAISCHNQHRENKPELTETGKMHPDTIQKYFPLRRLIDPFDTLDMRQVDGTGIFNSEFSIVYEKYESDSTSIDLILQYMSNYNLDTLNRNKFFTSSYNKEYLKIDFIKKMKMDIEFYEEMEDLKNIIHVGHYMEDKKYFISFDMTNEFIYGNYQMTKNNAR